MATCTPSPFKYAASWLVHLFTASGTCIGIFTLLKIYQHDYVMALWLMAIAIIIDAVDGTLARWAQVKKVLPQIDGALLDNIVDFLNYVITPCFFLLVNEELLPRNSAALIVSIIAIVSAYQFCQADAKTPDHFFKGFPCYWNIAIFYMFLLHTSALANAIILIICSALVFVPIKYVYPSRIDYLTQSPFLKKLMNLCSIIYGACSLMLLFNYPYLNPWYGAVSIGYLFLYLSLSVYHTCKPFLKRTA